jgi:hypothetical protein
MGKLGKQRRLTTAEIDAQIDAATKREAEERAAGLRADAVWYDYASSYLMLRMTNRRLFGVPVADVRYLHDLTPEQLGSVTLSPSGGGLHWEELDMHLDALGSRGVARIWATAAGRQTSPAKAKAARANGAKGGRPRKRKAA